MSFKRVGVLMGGLSKEREISLKSGRAVAAALRKKGYPVVEIDAGRNLAVQLASEKIDAAYIALHGRFGEDGTVQGLLELMGIPYTGSGIAASAISIDKDLTKRLVSQAGIRTPVWRAVYREELPVSLQNLALPVIVKPNREGSTIGMLIVREPAALSSALREAATYDDVILIEQFITGREVTVGIVNGKALPVLEVIPKSGFYDYQSKYTPGATEYVVPAKIPAGVSHEVVETSEKIWKVLGLSGVARIDFMIDPQGGSYFLEVNTIPGMTETSLVPKAAAAIGISFEELCDKILKTAGLHA